MRVDVGNVKASGALRRWRRRFCLTMAGGLAVVAVVGVVRTDQIERDRDGDGIPDCREHAGLLAQDGSTVWRTDPADADTDGDGVVDGEEVSPASGSDSFEEQVRDLRSCRALTFTALSDPTRADSDDDGLDDAVELSEGSDPFSGDSDDDELGDVEERAWGSDPYDADTDGDGFRDGADTSDGFTPVTVDEEIDDEEWHTEYAKGVGLGEFDDIDSVPQLLGALSGGLSGSIPVVGWLVSTITDVRDAIAGIINDDWTAVLISAAAVLPYAGDSAKAIKQITKFVENHPEQLRRVVQGILALENLPDSVRTTLLRAADPGGVDGLRRLEVSDEVIVKFAKRGTTLATLVVAMDKSAELIQKIPGAHADDEGFVETLEDAQGALREYAAEADGTDDVAGGPVYIGGLPQSTFAAGRLIDACTACEPSPELGSSTLRIAKLGSLHYATAVQRQIDKDSFLAASGYKLEWHFFAGPTGWTVDTAVLDALDEAEISYAIHLPE